MSFTIIGALLFRPYVLHGGFYLDDWADAAATLYPVDGSGFLHALSYFNELLASCRPVLIVFFPLKYTVFGTHMEPLLALSVVLAVLCAALIYAVLRTLGLPWYHAWVIGGLTIAYPWFDSTRFWESANPLSLAVLFAAAGLWVALIGLSRNSWKLHVFAALLYLLSMLTYETTLPVIAFAGLLYVFRYGWRMGRWRWGVDLAMVVAAGLWARMHTPRAISDLSGNISHLWEITTSGGELLARTMFPLGVQPHTALILAMLLAIGVLGIAWYALGPKAPRRQSAWGLRNWLLLAIGGLLVAALGWVMFIPADPYYTPSVFGFTNRVNGVAGFGLILAAYAVFGIIGSLVGQLSKRPATAVATTLVLGLMLGAMYVHVLERHSGLWIEAFRAERTAADRIKAAFPRLPHGTTVFASSYPAYLTLGVPIFAASWDLNGMIRLLYEDGTLRGYPVTEELQLVCRPKGIGVDGQGETIPLAPYGTARLLNLESGKSSNPRSQRECVTELDNYPPGPLYLSTSY